MAKSVFAEFKALNEKFIANTAFIMAQLHKFFWEFVWSLLMIVHREATPKFIGQHVAQSRDDLLKEDPKKKNTLSNQRDVLKLNQIIKAARKDYISWIHMQLPFNNKNKMAGLAQQFKQDLDACYKQRNK